jgi:hypothetical protein
MGTATKEIAWNTSMIALTSVSVRVGGKRHDSAQPEPFTRNEMEEESFQLTNLDDGHGHMGRSAA